MTRVAKVLALCLLGVALGVLAHPAQAQTQPPATQTWKLEKTFTIATTFPPDTLMLSPDGKMLAVCIADDIDRRPPGTTWTTLYIYDPATGKQVAKFPRLDQNSVAGTIAFSPDGTKMAHGGFFGDVQILDLKAGKVTGKFRPSDAKVTTPNGMPLDNSGQINSLVYSPDGKRIATTALHEFVTISDAETGKQILSVKHGGQPLLSDCRAAWSADGKALYVGVGDDIKVMDATTGQWGGSQKVKGGVSVIVTTGDSKTVAVGNSEGLIFVFSADLKTSLFTYKDHVKKQTPNSIPIFNPLSIAAGRDNTFISSAFDGVVKVWDGPTGKTAGGFTAPKQGQPLGYPTSISADGKRIAITAMAAKPTVRIWALQDPTEPKK